MKLIMTLLVRDEEDIIAANIDFHMAYGVDFIVATDNLSVDNTPQILREYERRGVLHYILQTDDNYAQHRWVTDMARLAHTKFGADWVINNDADEFWYPEHGDLKQVLDVIPPSYDAVVAERTNFVPRSFIDDGFFADVMTVREKRSLNAVGLPLPSKMCHRAFPDVDVEQGNHCVLRHGRPLNATSAPITIFHFPMRSYRQFANKIALGGAAYARNNYLPSSTGITWRRLYEAWKKDELKAYYRSLIADDSAVAQGLSDGRFVIDERLKSALQKFVAGRNGTSNR